MSALFRGSGHCSANRWWWWFSTRLDQHRESGAACISPAPLWLAGWLVRCIVAKCRCKTFPTNFYSIRKCEIVAGLDLDLDWRCHCHETMQPSGSIVIPVCCHCCWCFCLCQVWWKGLKLPEFTRDRGDNFRTDKTQHFNWRQCTSWLDT